MAQKETGNEKPWWASWKLYALMGVLLTLVLLPFFLFSSGGTIDESEFVQQEGAVNKELFPQEQVAFVAEQQQGGTYENETSLVFESVIFAPIAEWLDLIVLLIVLGFIIGTFVKLGDMFR